MNVGETVKFETAIGNKYEGEILRLWPRKAGGLWVNVIIKAVLSKNKRRCAKVGTSIRIRSHRVRPSGRLDFS